MATAKLEEEIKAKIHQMHKAINTRDLSLFRPLVAPKFRAQCTLFPDWDPWNIEEYLEFQERKTAQNPVHHNTVMDISVRIMGEGPEAVDVITNLEQSGIPAGIVRQAVYVNRFLKVKGEWLCTWQRSIIASGGVSFDGDFGEQEEDNVLTESFGVVAKDDGDLFSEHKGQMVC